MKPGPLKDMEECLKRVLTDWVSKKHETSGQVPDFNGFCETCIATLNKEGFTLDEAMLSTALHTQNPYIFEVARLAGENHKMESAIYSTIMEMWETYIRTPPVYPEPTEAC